MVSKVFSCSFIGLDCFIVEVQADVSNGLPSFSIVGLGDTSVQESKERVRSSIKNSNFQFPQTKKTINLAPANIRKQGALFDLPIAISLLATSQQISHKNLSESIFIGELSLTGQLTPVNGALAITQHAKENGFKKIFLPEQNAHEASFVDEIIVYPVKSLQQIVAHLNGDQAISQLQTTRKTTAKSSHSTVFDEIIGHEVAKRALTIAAAGGHNVLMSGSPGCGKTLLARAFQHLLPPMNPTETLETTKIFSVGGLLDPENPLVTKRPFREVHHRGSIPSIIGGGGTIPQMGEVSLAHNGVLFLDEISEFPRNALESLRQPLEDRYITINRANFKLKMPCNFTLIATTNPCPCGYLTDKKVPCVCHQYQIQSYRKKLSGPLLDRFDIFLQIEKVEMNKIFQKETPSAYEHLHRDIQNAVEMQENRFSKSPSLRRNCQMQLKEIKRFCRLNVVGRSLLEKATGKLNLSNRAYIKLIKVARTIADLDRSTDIKTAHLAEALQYRTMA